MEKRTSLKRAIEIYMEEVPSNNNSSNNNNNNNNNNVNNKQANKKAKFLGFFP